MATPNTLATLLTGAVGILDPGLVTAANVPSSSLIGGSSAGAVLTSAPITPTASSAPVASDVKNLGRWVLAFCAFLGILLFLKPGEAAVLSLTIVLGALMINAEQAAKSGKPTVIQTVLGGSG